MSQKQVPFPRGHDVKTLRTMRSIETVLMLNFMLSDKCRDSDFQEAYDEWAEENSMEKAIEIAISAYRSMSGVAAI